MTSAGSLARDGARVLEGVTFDLDGTLYDHSDVRLPLLVRCAFGSGSRLRALRVGKQVREELRARTFDSGAQLLEEEARVVAERLDITSDRARALLDAVYDDVLTSVMRRCRDPRVHTALASLAARVKIGVVSDRKIDDKLAALGLDDLPWAAKVSADDTGALKPAARPFLLACERMGVAPPHTAHVGDRDDMDGAGARAAGMRFDLVRGPRDLPGLVVDLLAHAR